MSSVKAIRNLLGVTQTALAEAIDCTQRNVGHYESGQMLPPDRAKALIDFAATHGVTLTMGQVYGTEPLPAPAQQEAH